ncbi:hypothetical protein, partial [Escherichia coli]|uniref:hypothetical protein n=2 Tax=Escherichia coli TaxID=562 RepID=UPI001BD0A5EC
MSFLRGFVASKKNAFRRRFLPPEICLFCDVIQGIQKEVRTTPDMCYQALLCTENPQLGWGFRKAFSFKPVIKTPFDLLKHLAVWQLQVSNKKS